MMWIPCSERMPEEGQEVLFVVRKHVLFGNVREGVWASFEEDETARPTDDATHWMPLPEPPNG